MNDEFYEDSHNYINDKNRHLVSGFTREKHELLFNKDPNYPTRDVLIITEDILNYIISQPPLSVIEKADKILYNLSLKTPFYGGEVNITDEHDYSLGYCKNISEFQYLKQYLLDSRQIKEGTNKSYLRITIGGWKRLDKLKGESLDVSQVFVAMNFSIAFKRCYKEAIEPAIRDAGYEPYRVDLDEHTDKIDDKIITEIKRSKFLVAEFTGQRQGVYFEAGFAAGLGKQVIWICHKDKIDELHFDTRQYNHIAWNTTDELKEMLFNRIIASVGFYPVNKQ